MNWQPWAIGLAPWLCPVLQTTGCVCVCVCVGVCVCVSAAQLCLTLCNPVDCSPPGLCPWNSPSRNTGVGCHALLQGIFPTQGSHLHLLQCVTRSPGEKKVMQMKSTGPSLEQTFTVLEIFFLCTPFSYLFPLLPSSWEVSCLPGIFLLCTQDLLHSTNPPHERVNVICILLLSSVSFEFTDGVL